MVRQKYPEEQYALPERTRCHAVNFGVGSVYSFPKKRRNRIATNLEAHTCTNLFGAFGSRWLNELITCQAGQAGGVLLDRVLEISIRERHDCELQDLSEKRSRKRSSGLTQSLPLVYMYSSAVCFGTALETVARGNVTVTNVKSLNHEGAGLTRHTARLQR